MDPDMLRPLVYLACAGLAFVGILAIGAIGGLIWTAIHFLA